MAKSKKMAQAETPMERARARRARVDAILTALCELSPGLQEMFVLELFTSKNPALAEARVAVDQFSEIKMMAKESREKKGPGRPVENEERDGIWWRKSHFQTFSEIAHYDFKGDDSQPVLDLIKKGVGRYEKARMKNAPKTVHAKDARPDE